MQKITHSEEIHLNRKLNRRGKDKKRLKYHISYITFTVYAHNFIFNYIITEPYLQSHCQDATRCLT